MPIAMSKSEFARLKSWTDGSRECGAHARQAEYVRRLDELSSQMTREWPNSLENVNKRSEEMRRARHEAAEQANTRFYKKYMRNKREEQARLMYSARDTMFKNKDAPKMFLRAVIETCVQHERQAQLAFNAELQRLAAEQKRKDDDDIIRRSKEWHELMATRRQRRFEVNKQHQKDILQQAEELAERNRKDYETELNYQKIDNIKAAEQIEALEDFQRNFDAAEKARILADMKQSAAELAARRAEERARDQLDDKLIAVLQRSRVRAQARRKQTEQGVRDEQLRLLEMNSKRLASGDADRAAAEQARLDAAVREKEAVMEERRRKDKEKAEKIRRERDEVQAQFLAAEERRVHEMNTMRQWEMMNRFKNQELYDDYKEKQRLEKERKIKEFREETLRLWKERDERVARERAETRYFYGELAERKLRDADNKLFAHAQELLAEARRCGRPDYALRKAIDRYCCLYRLHPMPELPAPLQAHFPRYRPRDACAADPGYRPASPPRPEPRDPGDSPAGSDLNAHESKQHPTERRSGLQAVDKSSGGQRRDTAHLMLLSGGSSAKEFSEESPTEVKSHESKQEAPAPQEPAERRSGLQAVDKAGPSKQTAPKEESVADYKRAGRANGLQRRPAETDLLKLPPISVVPCQTPACSCPLKK